MLRMEYIEFKTRLKDMGISIGGFADQFGLHEASVSKWSKSGNMPKWVDATLPLLEKSKKYNKIIELIKDEE